MTFSQKRDTAIRKKSSSFVGCALSIVRFDNSGPQPRSLGDLLSSFVAAPIIYARVTCTSSGCAEAAGGFLHLDPGIQFRCGGLYDTGFANGQGVHSKEKGGGNHLEILSPKCPHPDN